MDCQHNRVSRGKDAPRRYGSFRTHICLDCLSFRLADHYDKPYGDWLKAELYDEYTQPPEDE